LQNHLINANLRTLQESVLQHEREELKLREEFAKEMSDTKLKLARAQEQLSLTTENLRVATQGRQQLEQDLVAANLSVERANAQVLTYKERCEAAEVKLNSRDGNLERALMTLGQNQQFSQERIDLLSKEKTRLEERVDELLQEAKVQTSKLFEMTAAWEKGAFFPHLRSLCLFFNSGQ